MESRVIRISYRQKTLSHQMPGLCCALPLVLEPASLLATRFTASLEAAESRITEAARDVARRRTTDCTRGHRTGAPHDRDGRGDGPCETATVRMYRS